MTNEADLLTTQELADILKLAPITIRRYMKLGLPYLKLSNRFVRFSLPDVIFWFQATYNQNKPVKEPGEL